jgi:hypothetical protein
MPRYKLRTLLILLAIGPPMLASGQAPQSTRNVSAPLLYEDTMLIIVSDDGVAAVVFRPTVNGSAAYDFRFEGKDGQTIENVDRPLYEQRNPDGKMGGEVFIKAGPIAVQWSKHSEKRGWIYYRPEKIKVYFANARDFTDRVEDTGFNMKGLIPRLDLQRFVK